MLLIENKHQLSQLASALKAVFEQRYDFPIKLSRAREAASQLASGLNHQNLLKQLPLEVKHFNVDALSQYLIKVHQKHLSEEAIKELGNEELLEILTEYSPDIYFAEKTQEAIMTDTIMCLFSVYASRFEILDEDKYEVEIPFNLIEELEKKFGTQITDIKAEIISPEYTEGVEIAEFWANLNHWDPVEPDESDESDEFDEHEYFQSFSLPRGPHGIRPSKISENNDETWVLEVPRFILAVAIKTSTTEVTPGYEVYTQHDGILGAISSDICHCEISTENAVLVEAAYLPFIPQDISDDEDGDELSYHFWNYVSEINGQTIFGDKAYGGWSFGDEETGFCTTYRAMAILKKEVDSGRLAAATIPISSTGDSWGVFGFMCLEQDKEPILAMSHFETFSCDHGSMSTSSHHFEGKYIIRNLFPDIKCYSILPLLRGDDGCEARWFNGVWEVPELWHKKGAVNQYIHTQRHSGVDYEYNDNVLIQPALFNAFNELIKHWSVGTIDPSDPELYSSSNPLFETRREELLSAGLDFIQVTDFQELYGDYTSVLTVGLFAGNQLLAELSYAVMLGAGEKQDPVEWQLDKAIKDFASKNKITLRWQEYTVLHPTANRSLSFYKSENTLLPVQRDMSFKESMLIMKINIKAPSCHEQLNLNNESLYRLSNSLLVNNCSRNGKPIPFFFSLLGRPNKYVGSASDIETLTEGLSRAIENKQKIIDDIPGLSDSTNIRGSLSFYTVFDLEGKPFDETHGMIGNVGARYRFKKATEVDTRDVVTEAWTAAPNLGDKFYIADDKLSEWESALGYIPKEVEFIFFSAN